MTTEQIEQFISTLAAVKPDVFPERQMASETLDRLIKTAAKLRISLFDDDTPELCLLLARRRIYALKRRKITKTGAGLREVSWVLIAGFSTIVVPFNPRFNFAAKRSVPNFQWESEQSCWSFPTSQTEKVAEIAAKYFKADALRLREIAIT